MCVMPRLSESEPVPLLEDPRLPNGWKRSVTQKMSGRGAGTYDVSILDPKGKTFKSRAELARHLKSTRSKLKADDFDFTVWGKSSSSWRVSAEKEVVTVDTPKVNGNDRRSGRGLVKASPASSKTSNKVKSDVKKPDRKPEKLVNHHPPPPARPSRKMDIPKEMPSRRSARNQLVVENERASDRKRPKPRSPPPAVSKKTRKNSKSTSAATTIKEEVPTAGRRKSGDAARARSPPSASRSRVKDKVVGRKEKDVKQENQKPTTNRARGRPAKTNKLGEKMRSTSRRKSMEKVSASSVQRAAVAKKVKGNKKRGRQKKQETDEASRKESKPDLALLLGAKIDKMKDEDDNDSDVTDEYFSIFDEDPNLPSKRTPKPRQWSADVVTSASAKRKKQQQQAPQKQRKKSGAIEDVNTERDSENKPIEGLNDDDLRLSDNDILNVSEQYAIHGIPGGMPQSTLYAPLHPSTHLVSSLPTPIPAYTTLPPSTSPLISTQHMPRALAAHGGKRRRKNSDRSSLGSSVPLGLAAGLQLPDMGEGGSEMLEISEVPDVGGLDQYHGVTNQVQMISDRLSIPNHHQAQPNHAQQTSMSQMMAFRALQHHQNSVAAAASRGRRKMYDPSQAYYDHNYNRPYEESPEAIQQQLHEAAQQEQERLRIQLHSQDQAGLGEQGMGVIEDGSVGTMMMVEGGEQGAVTPAGVSGAEGVEFVDEQQPILLQTSSGDGGAPGGQYVLVRGSLGHLPYNLQVVGLDGNPLAAEHIVL